MKKNFKNHLLIFLGMACLASLTTLCERKDLDDAAPTEQTPSEDGSLKEEDGEITTSALSPNIIYNDDMEGSAVFAKAHNIENCATSWTLAAVANPVFQGTKSARFEIRKDQPLVGSGEKIRSEVTIIKGTEYPNFPRDVWYSYAILFPASGFEYDETRDCINQWYEDGSDETTIRTEKDKAYLEVTPAEGSSTLMRYDLFGTTFSTKAVDGFANIPKDKWHEFVFHFIHSKSSDGLIEVWRDGVKIHTIQGRNMHLELPKWKIGLYKASFLDKSSSRYSRVVYFDNVRVGNSSATFAEMSSQGSGGGSTSTTTSGSTAPAPSDPSRTPEPAPTPTPTPTPTPPPPTTTEPAPAPAPSPSPTDGVVSFTLVNSSTDKDIMTLTNGAVINRSTLKVSKFNVRANAASGKVIKFELTGAQRDTRIDDAVPYALGGDSNGDYNSWTPSAGTYRLEANTFSGTKKRLGSATGTPLIISFTVQ